MIEYKIPDDLDLDALSRALSAATLIEHGPGVRVTQRFLDTFDWRIHTSGHSLLFESDRRGGYLIWRARDGDGITVRVAVESLPRWPAQLPDGPFGDRLRSVLNVRTLRPLGCRRLKRQPMRVLDPAGKTVLKLRIERAQTWQHHDSNRRMCDTSLWVDPLAGYPKSMQRLEHLLGELGLHKHKVDPARQCLKALAVSVYDRGTRYRVTMDANTPSNQALRLSTVPLVEVMVKNARGVIEDIDTECLHDLRVSIRRTRAALACAHGVFPARTVSRFRAGFGWLGRVTGGLRDFDVQLLEYDERVSHPARATPGALIPYLELVTKLRAHEHRKVTRTLSSVRFARLLSDWTKWLNSPVPLKSTLPDAARPVEELARTRIRSIYKRVRRQGRAITDTSPDEALHRLRKSCKALRYSLELFKFLFARRQVEATVKTLKQLQDTLGNLQDSVVQAQNLRRLSGQLTQPDTYAAIAELALGHEHRRDVAREAFAGNFELFLSHQTRSTFRKLLRPHPR